MLTKPSIIAVDFDGTCVTHAYPEVGVDVGAIPVLCRLAGDGHRIILHTMRDGDHLSAAVAWFAHNNIPLFGVNHNPTQSKWTASPKVYAHLYIDDAALGCPLLWDEVTQRNYVDWKRIADMLWPSNQGATV